jgi:hypothetical protein
MLQAVVLVVLAVVEHGMVAVVVPVQLVKDLMGVMVELARKSLQEQVEVVAVLLKQEEMEPTT